MMADRTALRDLGIYLAAVAFVGFGLFPLYLVVTTSFKNEIDVFAWPPVWWFEPSFEAYHNALFVFGGRSVLTFVFNSVLVTLLSTAAAVALGSMAVRSCPLPFPRQQGHRLHIFRRVLPRR